jgi:hypothetical protein
MTRFMKLTLALALTGSLLAGRSMSADKPGGPGPTHDGGGPGGPGGGGPGGGGARRGGGGEGGPGGGGAHLIPRFAEDKLNLSDEQRKQIADLEKEMKDKLAKILTPDQMKALEDACPPQRGQGGPGGGGLGGPGGGGQGGPGGGGPAGGGGGGGQGGRGGAGGGGGHPAR